jgi:2-oxoglutarate ferredoxin oxidoreductase subunit alpha
MEPVGFSKVEGLPFNEMEIEAKITDILKEL